MMWLPVGYVVRRGAAGQGNRHAHWDGWGQGGSAMDLGWSLEGGGEGGGGRGRGDGVKHGHGLGSGTTQQLGVSNSVHEKIIVV